MIAELAESRRRTGCCRHQGRVSRSDPGSVRAHRAAIDNLLEARLGTALSLAWRPSDVCHHILREGAMRPHSYALNGEHWPWVMPLMLDVGHCVAIDLVNRSMMAHPIHLHGRAFRAIATNGRRSLARCCRADGR